MKVLGIMSGSSLDGIDFALLDLEGNNPKSLDWRLLQTETFYPKELFSRLENAHNLNGKDLVTLDAMFAQVTAKKILEFGEVDLVSSHGHTVFHNPSEGYTTQLGNGGLIHGFTGIPVVSDFRTSDVAMGGQGAPLVPGAEKLLFPNFDYFLNLGGIANISDHSKLSEVKAFDVGPCNQVSNYFSAMMGAKMDENGNYGRVGKVDETQLDYWDSLDYYSKVPPKSLGNDWVKDFYLKSIDNLKPEDCIATFYEHLSHQISNAVKGVSGIGLITGGGAHNKFLVEKIRAASSIHWKIPENEIIDFKEAIIFALLGYLRILEINNILPSVTGARSGHFGGALYGKNPRL